MAVYTKISDKDITLINKKFKLGKKIKFQGIKKGIENTNYLLKTEKGKFILTIFEKRVRSSDLPFFMKLMDLLSFKKIICPKPLKDNFGKYLFKIKNKKACIVSFLSGKDKNNLTYKNCFEVGKNIAKMHKATKNFKIKRSNSMGINKLHPLLNSINFKKSKLILSYKKFLYKNLEEIKKNWPKKLPSGIILSNDEELGKKFNTAVFPGYQGGPLMHIIAAKAAGFLEALQPEFQDYIKSVLANAKILAETLKNNGFKIYSDGTDTHLMLVDLRPFNVKGNLAAESLSRANITCNKNGIPFDTEKPMITSGIRLGTQAATTRGFGLNEFKTVGELITKTIKGLSENPDDNSKVENEVRNEVINLTSSFPIYKNL